MSTRSVIAVGTAERWRGCYAHWDGCPCARGAQLFATYRELGSIEALRRYAVREGGSWSSYQTPSEALVEAAKPDLVTCDLCAGTGVRPVDEYKKVANEECNGCSSSGMAPNRDKQMGWSERSDDAEISSDGPDCGTEWCYLLGDDALLVFERRFGAPDDDRGHGTGWFGLGASDSESGGFWTLVLVAPWEDDEPDWMSFEASLR